MKKTILIAVSAAMLLTGCMSREETEALSAWTEAKYTRQAQAIQQSAAWRDRQVKQDEQDTAAIPEAAEVITTPVPVWEPEETVLQDTVAEAPPAEDEAVAQEAADEAPPAHVQDAYGKEAVQPDVQGLKSSVSWRKAPATTPQDKPAVHIPYDLPIIIIPTPPASWGDVSDGPVMPDPSEGPAVTPVPPTATPVEPVPAPTPAPEPEPVETPPAIPEPTPTPAGGYAVCSCGATLMPDELVPHMKAHAMNGESHSYIAY